MSEPVSIRTPWRAEVKSVNRPDRLSSRLAAWTSAAPTAAGNSADTVWPAVRICSVRDRTASGPAPARAMKAFFPRIPKSSVVIAARSAEPGTFSSAAATLATRSAVGRKSPLASVRETWNLSRKALAASLRLASCSNMLTSEVPPMEPLSPALARRPRSEAPSSIEMLSPASVGAA